MEISANFDMYNNLRWMEYEVNGHMRQLIHADRIVYRDGEIIDMMIAPHLRWDSDGINDHVLSPYSLDMHALTEDMWSH